jgi:hypothetical protein
MIRAAALLLAAAATLSLAPAPPALGWGGIVLGMSRADALAAAGPGALVGPLCGDAEGVTFDRAAAGVALRPDRPVTVMAMFADNQVTEMDVLAAEAEGGWTRADCLGAAEARLAALAGGLGTAAPAFAALDNSVLYHATARIALPQGEAGVIVRHMPRSGACFINLRWVAAGRQPVIP